jgi:probable FeS assembly SUF system protein SufT
MSDDIILKRDCAAVLIPAGDKITLQAGEPVVITQSLGGSFTVIIHGNMARIDARDADALGQAPPAAAPVETTSAPASSVVTEEQVLEKLRTCYDPEIPVNIVDLGLVYDTQIQPMPGGGSRVEIKMTLTAPECAAGSRAHWQARRLPYVGQASSLPVKRASCPFPRFDPLLLRL